MGGARRSCCPPTPPCPPGSRHESRPAHQVRADRVAEYEAAHRQFPAEPTEAIRTAGATSADLEPEARDIRHQVQGEPDRLVFGSDRPVCTCAQVIDTTHELISDLGAAGRVAVLAGTATRVYRF